MLTIQDILSKSIEFLTQKGIKNPRRQAEEVIGDALGIKRLQLYLQFDRPLTDKEVDHCRKQIVRRGKGEPCQYIRGYVDFLDCKIKVTNDVLIPRQETEVMTAQIIQQISQEDWKNKTLWDVCCGSGCIGIAIKHRLPELNVILSDVSDAAISIATENAQLNNVNLIFLHGDLLTPFAAQKTHYLVSNPPYVSENDYANLDREVKDFEPRSALLAKEQGFEFYNRFAKDLPSHLHPSGKAWLEIGHGQGERVTTLFSSPVWKKKNVGLDWAGHDRFFFLEIE